MKVRHQQGLVLRYRVQLKPIHLCEPICKAVQLQCVDHNVRHMSTLYSLSSARIPIMTQDSGFRVEEGKALPLQRAAPPALRTIDRYDNGSSSETDSVQPDKTGFCRDCPTYCYERMRANSSSRSKPRSKIVADRFTRNTRAERSWDRSTMTALYLRTTIAITCMVSFTSLPESCQSACL